MKKIIVSIILRKKYFINKSVLYRSTKEEHFMLLAQDGAITFFHTDHTSTSVFYAVLKGLKVFYLVRPTKNNVELFAESQRQPRNKFFGANKDLDVPCQKIVVCAGEAILLGPGMMHFVETIGTSVAVAVNFVHSANILASAVAFQREMAVPGTYLYKSFIGQVIAYIFGLIQYVVL